MKKYLIYSLIALAFTGCAEYDLTEPVETANVAQTMSEIRTRSLSGAVYNEILDAWMIPQKDPYTLENFQKAYDKLAAGKSAQSLSKAQAAEFSVTYKLKPTHYALKIYPRNEEEQWRIEMMEDVGVSYHPFDYARLTQEEVEKLPQKVQASTDNTFTEKSPYFVSYEDYKTADGTPAEPLISQLPILYTVWPIDKPLPDEMEYVIDYKVFLPHSAEKTCTAESLNILENEAVSAALGVAPIRIMPTTRAIVATVTGTAKTYDNSLNVNVPMPNLLVQYWNGSNYGETTTSYSGSFSLNLTSASTNFQHMPLTFIFQNTLGKWKITGKGDTSPLVNLNYTPTFSWRPGLVSFGEVVLQSSSANEIHRAANYYFNQQNYFPKYTYSGGLNIVAYSADESRYLDWNGQFTHNLNTCYISIRNLGYYNPDSDEPGGTVYHADVIGTTLHELGHYIHWNERGKYNNFDVVPRLLRESFASYSGWHMGQEFYKSLGWVHPGGNPSISSVQARQSSWHKTVTSDFKYDSPLFIDLADDYNQRTYYGSSYPQDEIKNVPASVIWSIVSNSPTWAACRSKIVGYVGTQYCTPTQLSVWLSEFDTWFANPANQ